MPEPEPREAPAEAPTARRGPVVRALLDAAFLATAVLLMWGLMHVSTKPVRPDQKAPRVHVQSTCAVCHTVSPDAEPVKVDRP